MHGSIPVGSVLLVEDNEDDAELIEHLIDPLKTAGLIFEHCTCLKDALIRLQRTGIELILLDLNLPDSLGTETIKRIREAAPSLPLVVLTGAEDDELAMQALTHGAQDYLTKGRIDLSSLSRSMSFAVTRQAILASNAQLAAIVETSDVAIIGKTINGTITSWNKGAENLFGYSALEAKGNSVGIIIPPDLPGELAETLERLRRGEVIRQETVRVTKHGERLDVSQTTSPIGTQGIYTSAASIGHNITEQKSAERALRDTENRLALALRAAEVGVWDFDLTMNTVWRSLRHDEIFGHQSLLPLWNFDIFITYVVPEDRDHVKEVFHQGLKDGHFKMEYRIVRASDNAIRWISAQGETFRDNHGNPIRTMGTVTDATERKEQEEQQRLMAILKEREDFMATLTHDMKNPLIGANRLLDLFIQGKLGELTNEQRELLECMLESNSGVLKLISNLTDVYRLQKEVNTIFFQKGNLTKMIASCVSRMNVFAKLRGITVTTSLAVEMAPVRADFDELERVVQNLLDNALKFTPNDGTIKVRSFSEDSNVLIEVEDNGPGISTDEMPLLFKRFSQGETGKRYTGGSGLGLYLCKRIIEAHGGTIECRSHANQSTIFRASLPQSKEAT